eukprot:3940878-Rhodomonas_salina.1
MTEVFQVNGGLDCASVFTLAVTTLEYMDVSNIVVTVVHTTLAAAQRLGDGTQYQLGYLHPTTMQF